MRFTIKKISLENIPELMRQARYRHMGQSGEQMSFVRCLGQNSYPRFHVYLSEGAEKKAKSGRKIFVILHLDQKRMSYKGSPAHSGDYDGKLIKEEARRIKEFFKKP